MHLLPTACRCGSLTVRRSAGLDCRLPRGKLRSRGDLASTLNSHREFGSTASIDASSAVPAAGVSAPISWMPFLPPLPFCESLRNALQSFFMCPSLPQWKHFVSSLASLLSDLPFTWSLPFPPLDALTLYWSLPFSLPFLPTYPISMGAGPW